MSIKFKIKEFENKYSSTEEKISRYILENLEEVREITSAQLAERAGVGQSSVIKFIKKIGFTGFTDFKLKLSEELGSKKTFSSGYIHNNISVDDSLSDATKKISYNHMESIEATVNTISYDILEEAVEEIDRARKIIILGTGASSLVGRDLQNKLTKIGKLALHDSDSHVQITHVVSSGKGDVVIAISNSGENSAIAKCLSHGSESGMKIISITGSSKNTIGDLSHLNISTAVTENFIRSSALSSRIAQLTIVDALFIGILKKNFKDGMDYIEASSRIIKELDR